jgi:hypothetical protein
MMFSSAGPALATSSAHHEVRASQAGAPIIITKHKCSRDVCETVTLSGGQITVVTTARSRQPDCIFASVRVTSPTADMTFQQPPGTYLCDQISNMHRAVQHIKRRLALPVTVISRWTRVSGAPSVTFTRP